MRKLTHAEFLALRRFDALDGLRAIAAVIVVFFHFGGPKTGFLSGWIGVHVFFIVSGFLITTLMLREKDRTGRISLRNFYLRRIFRIMPLYYVALAIVLVSAYHNGYGWILLKSHLPHYLTFMNEYHLPAGTPFFYSWTIGIEQKFYLVWPLALIIVSAISHRLRIPAALAGVALALVPYSATWRGMGIHYSVLLTGALLAVVLHSPRGFAILSPLTHPLAGVVVGIGFLYMHLHLADIVWNLRDEQQAVFIYGVGVAILLPSLLGPGVGRWILSLRPLVFVGERSYGLYLLQGPAVTVFVAFMPRLTQQTPLFGTAVTLVALFAADALHHRVEKPMIALGRQLIRKLDGQSGRSHQAADPQPADTTEQNVLPNQAAPAPEAALAARSSR